LLRFHIHPSHYHTILCILSSSTHQVCLVNLLIVFFDPLPLREYAIIHPKKMTLTLMRSISR
jgi:hypothetical protein